MYILGLFVCRVIALFSFIGNRRIRRGFHTILFFVQKRWMGLFLSITIETTAYCNRQCDFCPNNDKYPPREKGIMRQCLFDKLITELGKLNYSGRISPHLYGEPLTDKRMVALVGQIRRACPFAKIMVFSNGDFLTKDILRELIKKGMDEIYVTNYDNDDKPELCRLQQQYGDFVSVRKFVDVEKRNKAGLLENVEKAGSDMRPCPRPASQLVVNWRGDVVLCCNDYYGKYLFGNVEEKGLINIWQSHKYSKFKDTLLKSGGRKEIDLCKECNG
ncbi:MAG: radical SAM protein [Anaerolinea sp.]|nr:radical SAM protein [Anaerolinea sp.]